MNLIDPLPHQVPFEKWLKARFPFIGTHKVRRDPNPFKPDNEWEYGSEVAQACYEAYCRGHSDGGAA
jgi:hypothetical protein